MNNITSSEIQVDSSGNSFLRCYVSDGSIWDCDIKGDNWRQVKISDKELTAKFNETNNKRSL